jgi:hypothetical protein
VEMAFAEGSLDFLDIIVCTRHDGNDHDLTRREPERPSTGEVLCKDTTSVSKDTWLLQRNKAYAMNRSKDP